MASSVLEMIKEEVTCPICLELLKEPVSADCNHSFCRACITLNYESNRNTDGKGNCPVCRVPYPFGNLKPNLHVANIVERLKGFKSIPEEEQKVNICAQHGEKLRLFCRKDMMVICWLCERSQEHRGHQTALIEEVDQEYKEKLQGALRKLMKKAKICDEWQDDLQLQRVDWENQIQINVENVQRQFKGLRDLLDSKENEELQKLKKEKKEVMEKLEESENELEDQTELVRDLISDVEHHLQLSTLEMLQGANCVLRRRHSYGYLMSWISGEMKQLDLQESVLKPATAPKCPPKEKKNIPSSRSERHAASVSRTHGYPAILGSYDSTCKEQCSHCH